MQITAVVTHVTLQSIIRSPVASMVALLFATLFPTMRYPHTLPYRDSYTGCLCRHVQVSVTDNVATVVDIVNPLITIFCPTILLLELLVTWRWCSSSGRRQQKYPSSFQYRSRCNVQPLFSRNSIAVVQVAVFTVTSTSPLPLIQP